MVTKIGVALQRRRSDRVIAGAGRDLRRIARELGVKRLAELTPAAWKGTQTT